MAVSIPELQSQRRWVLHKQKVPHQPNGKKAMPNNPATWSTYADCMAAVSEFDGVGLALGNGVFGVDIDKCADAVSGKFTPESRAVVIELDSYGEYSPSGTGCHVLCIGRLPGPGIKKPFGGGAIEIKADGFYFTFTARHLSKTPSELMDRQEQVTALYERFAGVAGKLIVSAPADEEARFKKLMAGDMTDYRDDHSSADLALCGILARRCNNNLFLIDREFRKSGLFREKWEREDYASRTILKAIKGEPVFEADAEVIEDDSPTDYIVEAATGPSNEGWFPKGEMSLVGASSGGGKTYWVMTMLEKVRRGADVWGHTTKSRDYRVLLHDRSKKAMMRTARALHLPPESIERIIRLTTEQQSRTPAEILEAAIQRHPGAEAWFIEGLDLWMPDANKMAVAAPILDALQRVATRYNVAVIGSVGAPKQKGKDKYFGRDALFGSSALARKVETIVLIALTNLEDDNSVRSYTILPRNGRAERLYMDWKDGALRLTEKPETADTTTKESTAFARMRSNVLGKFKAGDPVTYSLDLGAEKTFYRWREYAVSQGLIVLSDGKYYVSASVRGVTWGEDQGKNLTA